MQLVKSHYDDYDGFVILQVQTQCLTASALSFMFQNLTKPIIFTALNFQLVLRTDGKENLITALEIAADKDENVLLYQKFVPLSNSL